MNFSITSSNISGMLTRRYAHAVMAIAAAWLIATMAANVLIDPQAVFGTELVRSHHNANARYLAFRTYQSAPDRYDAVLFASSRGNAFDRALLAERLGVRAVVNFSVPFGLLSDHLPELDYLVRDKAARHQRLAAVVLMLDADFFGKQPWTNLNIDSFLPPQISGESPLKFWWRYLTAFQFRNWKEDVVGRVAAALPPPSDRPNRARPTVAAFLPGLGAVARGLDAATAAALEETSAPEIRSDLARQLALLRTFVSLCRAHDIRLLAAFSPLNRRNVDDEHAPDNERIVEAVSRVLPVMDFGRPKWLSDRPDLWRDFSHYSPAVAAMMIDRMLGRSTEGPADFGQMRGR
jgi:hypothetical protein